jgi:hypothetical protein
MGQAPISSPREDERVIHRGVAISIVIGACGGAREATSSAPKRCHLAGTWSVSLPLLDDNHPEACAFSLRDVALVLDTDAVTASKLDLPDYQPWNFRTEGAPAECRYKFTFRTNHKAKDTLLAFELHDSQRGAVGEVTVGRGFIDVGNKIADLGACRTTASVELRSNER